MRVLFLGASIVHGWYAATPATAVTARVASLLGSEGVSARVWVVAVPGARAAAAETWSWPSGMDVAIVHLVTNDFTGGVALARYRSVYEALLRRVARSSPGVRLVCLGAWMAPSSRNRRGLEAAAYDRVVGDACGRAGGSYVRLGPIFERSGVRGPIGSHSAFGRRDGFHPNDLGHLLIAEAIVDGLHPAPNSASLGSWRRPASDVP